MKNKYIDIFLRKNHLIELLTKKIFPNSKEITESMGALMAIKKHIPYKINDPSINCIVVGDGHSPRTGALIAKMTNWKVFSIDPAIRKNYYGIDRLHTISKKIDGQYFQFAEKSVIVAVHSHADPEVTIKSIQSKEKYFINIPCCVKCNFKNPIVKYNDEFIHSEKNEISIFKF